MRRRISLLALSIFALCLVFPESRAQDEELEPGQRRDEKLGLIVSDDASVLSEKMGPTCTLTVTPGTVTNGQTVNFSVSYSPCQTGARVETFTFSWASSLPRFTENTVRQKLFFTDPGCVASSFDAAIVPTALAINGLTNVRVEVRGNGFDCTASTTVNVI